MYKINFRVFVSRVGIFKIEIEVCFHFSRMKKYRLLKILSGMLFSTQSKNIMMCRTEIIFLPAHIRAFKVFSNTDCYADTHIYILKTTLKTFLPRLFSYMKKVFVLKHFLYIR